MRDWFEGLAPRERMIVVSGSAFVGVILFWALVLAPLGSSVTRLDRSIESKGELIDWMQQAASRIQRAGPGGSSFTDTAGSLLVVINRSLRAAGLESSLQNSRQDGENVRVMLRDAPFAAVTGWLVQLQTASGIAIESAMIERSSTSGRVNANVVLRRS